ncbi:Histidine kinase-like ATPase domain-containing protein [Janthinobacterium sp. TND4EL3]|nr:Histidine kinase-like ATPase domain-containing protein [Janthinobacterium sp. TND4EL3]
MTQRILTANIASELDVVGARQRARQIAGLCGFGVQDQVRIATAVSELARNVYNYAGSGKIHFAIDGQTAPQVFTIRIEDQGPGIAGPQLQHILAGSYRSPTGMGLGILGAQRLMDRFHIDSAPGAGTQITLQKLFPREAPLLDGQSIGALGGSLQALPPDITLAEVQQQNRELLATLAELKTRQDDLLQLTRELEDTNRGVVALYAELDEKADHLRRADQMKSRFLSNMSHEFRTPLSSIRALSKLLLDRVDGELSGEQEKQVLFILQGAVSLSDLVNDLLDLAKIEAGKVDVHANSFQVADLFSALRGMLRPLLVSESLTLTFIAPDPALQIHTDEGKLSQILRNFISNALKFTEAGAIIVSATPPAGAGRDPLCRLRHGPGHRRRGRAADLRGIQPGGKPHAAQGQGHGPGPAPVPQPGGPAQRHGDRGKHAGQGLAVFRGPAHALPAARGQPADQRAGQRQRQRPAHPRAGGRRQPARAPAV